MKLMHGFPTTPLDPRTAISLDDILNTALEIKGVSRDTLVELWLQNFESCLQRLVSPDWVKYCDPGSERKREAFIRLRIESHYFQLNMLLVCLDLFYQVLDINSNLTSRGYNCGSTTCQFDRTLHRPVSSSQSAQIYHGGV